MQSPQVPGHVTAIVRGRIYIVPFLGAECLHITQIEAAVPRSQEIVVRLELETKYQDVERVGQGGAALWAGAPQTGT